MEKVCIHTENTLTLYKTYFFVMEKYFEDVRQDEKHVPDLLESIMKPKLLVKAELRPISFKINKFRHQILKIRV